MLGTFPLGRHHKQRLAVSSAEHTGEAPTIKLERLQHLSPFTDAHATLVSHVGVPECPFGIEANPVRMIGARLGSCSPM